MRCAGKKVDPAAQGQAGKPQEASDAGKLERLPGGGTRITSGKAGDSVQIITEYRPDMTMRTKTEIVGNVTTTTYYEANGSTASLVVRRSELENGNVSIAKSYADGRVESWSGTRAEEEHLKDEMLARVGIAPHEQPKARHPRLFGDATTAVTGPREKKTEAPASSPPTPPASKPKDEE